MSEPLVSVKMVTYNHVRYIRDAIEGVLQQKVDFPLELVIGEDCSTDGTKEIVFEYQKKYPNIIKVITSDKNIGAKQNSLRTTEVCKGKYIAFCEGDDYWIDCDKLQKQIDLLERNIKYAGCFHNAKIIKDDNEREASLYCRPNQKRFVNAIDLLETNMIPTCSIVIRRALIPDFPGWVDNLIMRDWPLHFLVTKSYGPLVYLNEVMAVYRNHSGGLWGSMLYPKRLKANLEFYLAINRNYPDPYKKITSYKILQIHYQLADYFESIKDCTNAEIHKKMVKELLSKNRYTSYYLRYLMRQYSPGIFKLIKSMRKIIKQAFNKN